MPHTYHTRAVRDEPRLLLRGGIGKQQQPYSYHMHTVRANIKDATLVYTRMPGVGERSFWAR